MRTLSEVSFADVCASPKWEVFPVRLQSGNRPLEIASWALSFLVPRKRCAGFTQSLTSHLCNTKSPFGMSLPVAKKLKRCALIFFLRIVKIPYPLSLCAPTHFRQSPSMTMFFKKRARSDSVIFITNGIPLVSYVNVIQSGERGSHERKLPSRPSRYGRWSGGAANVIRRYRMSVAYRVGLRREVRRADPMSTGTRLLIPENSGAVLFARPVLNSFCSLPAASAPLWNARVFLWNLTKVVLVLARRTRRTGGLCFQLFYRRRGLQSPMRRQTARDAVRSGMAESNARERLSPVPLTLQFLANPRRFPRRFVVALDGIRQFLFRRYLSFHGNEEAAEGQSRRLRSQLRLSHFGEPACAVPNPEKSSIAIDPRAQHYSPASAPASTGFFTRCR